MKNEFKEKTKEELVQLLEDLMPIVKSHYENKCSWENLPFIPEDCGFEATDVVAKGESINRTIYYRDGVSCSKVGSVWTISKGSVIMPDVALKNKFHAYQFFLGFGVEFDYSKTTVPDAVLLSVDELLEKLSTKKK